MNNKRGFSLIELLMVVAIIGLLSTIVLGSLNQARLAARDSRRIQDMKSVQNALALYAVDNGGQFPSVGVTTVASLTALVPSYIARLPHDPTKSGMQAYRYNTYSTTNFDSYTILVDLEGDATQWCKIRMPGWTPGLGHPAWENDDTNFPVCQ